MKQILIENLAMRPILVSEYCGDSLLSLCFCHCKDWQKTVQVDITNALKHLHTMGFVFVDIHPGNIVCRELNGVKQAKLIDLESITPLTQTQITCRVVFAFLAPDNPYKPSISNDFASLNLVLAWMENAYRFRQVAFNDYYCSESLNCLKRKIINQ